ncbi:MAG: hypothetical protein HY931_03325 [Candidatus Falkowbacteria bacterium]|nr:MAG: hypothetical protein HY931_03325 [Candidatus Falkowbacteria bacterium]
MKAIARFFLIMKNFSNDFVQFFKTSPLSKGRIVLHLSAMGFLAAFFIIGGIYGFAKGDDFSTLVFVLVGLICLAAGIVGINPKSCKAFWIESLPPDDSRFDG